MAGPDGVELAAGIDGGAGVDDFGEDGCGAVLVALVGDVWYAPVRSVSWCAEGEEEGADEL